MLYKDFIMGIIESITELILWTEAYHEPMTGF